MKILIIEDDRATGELLSATLAANRYTVDLATDGMSGLELVGLWEYDLIVLDVKLPELDGIQVCQILRSKGNKTPILMLTAQESDRDVITGLDAGADDYVIKPCNLDQLLARVRSLLRRQINAAASILEWGEMRLDPATGRVTFGSQELLLRRKEYLLLELFLSYPQRIFSRSAILDRLWTADNFPSEGAITNLIKDLRRQLAAAGVPDDFIETLYGLGYRLKALPQSQQPTPIAAESEQSADSIAQITARFQTTVRQRLSQLTAIAQQLLDGQAELADCRRLKTEVHQLAGNLGLYGYDAACQLARSIDRLLAAGLPAVAPDGTPDAIPDAAPNLAPNAAISMPALQAAQLVQWFTQLQQELDRSPLSPYLSCNLAGRERSQSDQPLVLVISEDDAGAEALQQASRQWQLQIELIPAWEIVQQFVFRPPAAIVLETKESASDAALVCQITQQFPAIPVLLVAAQADLASRVAAADLGIARYLVQPVAPVQLLETIASLLPGKQFPDRTKVLIVDDDPEVHPRLSCLLQSWSLETVSLENPKQFWQVLTRTQPDAVLLDIEMPQYNGIELCRVLRQDIRYRNLPIFVMTAYAESDWMRQVFAAGANDLLHKSIGDAELVRRVVNRLQQFLQQH